MTQRINIPGHGLVDFPANMPDEQIAEAIKRNAMHSTFLGQMPRPNIHEMFSPENVNKVINMTVAGHAPGMNVLGSPTGLDIAGKVVNYFRPQKTATEFMKEIGAPKTAEENIEELANRANFARKSAASEALSHKEPVLEALGNKNIYNPLVSLMIKKGGIPEHYSGDLRDIYSQFMNNPILKNSDKFQQQLGDEIRTIQRRIYEGKADTAEKNLLPKLIKDRNDIMRHNDTFMERQSPKLKESWDKFRNIWRENVSIFDEHPVLAEMARKGTKQGFTPGEVKSIFQYPSSSVEKVAGNIGPSGKSNILYNELQQAGIKDPHDLAKELLEMNQHGYQKYITEKMKDLSTQLGKRTKAREYLNLTAKTGAGALLGGYFGHPLVGATIGAATKPALKYGKKVIDIIK